MKKKTLTSLLAGLLLVACSPKITSDIISSHQPLPKDAEVVLLEEDDVVPDNAEVLGRISIGDSGFTTVKNGTYEAVTELAKQKARDAGGNVLKIVKHKSPDFWNTTYRMEADIIHVDDLSSLQKDCVVELPAHPDYAVIHFWRNGGVGALVTYDVYVGDTKVYRSSPGTKAEVKVYDEGNMEIRAKTESKTTIILDLKKGGDYYVRTGVVMGVMVGRPSLDVVDAAKGIREYESVQK